MSSTYAYTFKLEVESKLSDLGRMVNNLKEMAEGPETTAELEDVSNLVAEVEADLETLTLEIDDLPPGEASTHSLRRDVSDFEEQIATISSQVELQRHRLRKADLTRGAKSIDVENLTSGQHYAMAHRFQDKTKASLIASRAMMTENEDTALAQLDTAQAQTKQIERIDGTLDEMNTELDVANAQLRRYFRTISTDKLIMVMICLALLGIIFIVVYKIINPDSNITIPDERQFTS